MLLNIKILSIMIFVTLISVIFSYTPYPYLKYFIDIIFPIFISILILKKTNYKIKRDFFLLFQKKFIKYIIYYFLLFTLYICVIIFIDDIKITYYSRVKELNKSIYLIEFIKICITAPIFEEILFRHYHTIS